MSGFDRRQWRSDLKTCINQIAKNFKQAISPQSSQIQQTPLTPYTRRITDDWVMEAKGALGLWEGEPLSILIRTKEDFDNVRKALEEKAESIGRALSTDHRLVLSGSDFPAAILEHIMNKSLGGNSSAVENVEAADELRRLGGMGTERKRKIEAEVRAREEEEKARRRTQQEASRRRATERNAQFRRRHPLPQEESSRTSAESRSPKEELRLKHSLADQVTRIVNTCSRANVNEETVARWKNEVYRIFGIGEGLRLNECIRNEEVIITMKTLLFEPFEANIKKDGLAAFDAPLNWPQSWLQYMQRFKPSDSSRDKKRPHSPENRTSNDGHPEVLKSRRL